MEVQRPLSSSNGLKQRSLTPLMVCRGLLCLAILLSTAFMFLVYCAPVAVILLRFVSIHYSRKVISFLVSNWLALWPFLFEKINNTKVVFSGETVPEKERVLLISNHRTEVDWMYLWDLALRKGCLGHIKYVFKSSLRKLPVFGWAFHVLEFIPVERKWEIDEPIMQQMLSTFTNPQDPLWLALFPEGTDYTEQKCKRSQQYAAENGLPILKYVLLPKTKGFYACLEVLRGSLDAVYDVTIAYKHRLPSFLDNVFGVDPSEVHIHVRRVPVEKIPVSESEVATWLMDTYQLKDQLLSDFTAKGHFPHQGTEGELSTLKCLVNFVVIISITGIFVYVTFFSSIWFKIYIGLSGAYLTFATYFNVRPMPVPGMVKAMLKCRKIKNYTIWPGTLSGNGASVLGDGGFVLVPGGSVQFPAPPGWSGRFWARTGCTFDDAGNGKCVTGDCGGLKCIGGGSPPVTLAEFTIASTSSDKDFYDVSLVDGYNVGMGVRALGGTGDCQYAGCVADLNGNCPTELQVLSSGSVVACKSACAAFNSSEFCCTGDHSTPETCSPTQYSEMFKNACPTAYSYAYDDASSTCTCSGSDYLITFCPPGS